MVARYLEPNVYGYEGPWQGTVYILYRDYPVLTRPLAAPPPPPDLGGHSTSGSTRENGMCITDVVRSSFVERAFRNCSRNLDTISLRSKPSKVNELGTDWIGSPVGVSTLFRPQTLA